MKKILRSHLDTEIFCQNTFFFLCLSLIVADFDKVAAFEADSSALITTSFFDASMTGIAANPTSFLPATGSRLLSAVVFIDDKLVDSFFYKTAN